MSHQFRFTPSLKAVHVGRQLETGPSTTAVIDYKIAGLMKVFCVQVLAYVYFVKCCNCGYVELGLSQ